MNKRKNKQMVNGRHITVLTSNLGSLKMVHNYTNNFNSSEPTNGDPTWARLVLKLLAHVYLR